MLYSLHDPCLNSDLIEDFASQDGGLCSTGRGFQDLKILSNHSRGSFEKIRDAGHQLSILCHEVVSPLPWMNQC